MIERMTMAAALLLLPVPVAAMQPLSAGPRVGESWEIRREYHTSQRDSEGSTGSTNGHDTLVERVTGLRDGGLELEYDLPADATAEDRARDWQFPARVFKPAHGPMELLNATELEARLETWLRAVQLTRAACGRWIFTWNAFRIECDPQSVIHLLEDFDLRPGDLRDGAMFEDPEAGAPGPMRRTAAGSFVVEMPIDADAVRRGRAESDLVTSEIMGNRLTREAAFGGHASEDVSGTLTITFETDSAGQVLRRTRVTEMEIRAPGEPSETHRLEESVERRLAASPGS